MLSNVIPRWFVVRTRSRSEAKARDALLDAGFGVYLPERRIDRQHRRSKAWITDIEPLLVGYAFVQFPADGSAGWRELRCCDGVTGVLGNIGNDGELRPVAVPGLVVERLMASQMLGAFDALRPARIDAEGLRRMFVEGDTIQPVGGPLAGWKLTVAGVTGAGMVQAMGELFGRLTTVTLHPRDLGVRQMAEAA